MTDITKSDEFNWAAVSLNPCSENLIPPAKKHIPKTSNKFERIDPSKEDWTTRSSHFTKAIIAIINSTAFP